ncbi:MAG: hypothetical protein KAS32_13515, partial [Candidatus Peribacteraceae bacterium]|nr:hypothetical protein [Candidatus Peribacteraceae bacterium]
MQIEQVVDHASLQTYMKETYNELSEAQCHSLVSSISSVAMWAYRSAKDGTPQKDLFRYKGLGWDKKLPTFVALAIKGFYVVKRSAKEDILTADQILF